MGKWPYPKGSGMCFVCMKQTTGPFMWLRSRKWNKRRAELAAKKGKTGKEKLWKQRCSRNECYNDTDVIPHICDEYEVQAVSECLKRKLISFANSWSNE
jgi:hypothetical protein